MWECSLGFPLEQESNPRSQVEVELLLESQELDPLGYSSLESHWGTPSRHPSCQVAMDCLTALGSCPLATGPEEWLVQRARLGTRQGQELVQLQQQRQLKQQSLVPQEPEFSRALVLEVPAFLGYPVQFLGLEASQGSGLQLLLQRRLLRQPNMELLELESLALASLALASPALASLALGSLALASLVLGSLVLGSLALGSLVLESQVLLDQGLCHQLQLLKQPPKQPNLALEPEWELEAFPLSGFLAMVSVSEPVFLELPFPLKPRQQLPPRQPSLVLVQQEP